MCSPGSSTVRRRRSLLERHRVPELQRTCQMRERPQRAPPDASFHARDRRRHQAPVTPATELDIFSRRAAGGGSLTKTSGVRSYTGTPMLRSPHNCAASASFTEPRSDAPLSRKTLKYHPGFPGTTSPPRSPSAGCGEHRHGGTRCLETSITIESVLEQLAGPARTLRSRDPTTASPSPSRLDQPTVTPTTGETAQSDRHCSKSLTPQVSSVAFPAHLPDLQTWHGYGLRDPLPARPTKPASYPVSVRSRFCSTLPSDTTSRGCPCALLILHLHQVG